MPHGFEYLPNYISEAEEEELLSHIKQLDWQSVVMYGVTAKRKVVHYGLDYTFETRQVIPTKPAPPFLTSIINKAALSLKVKPSEIAEILISEYPIGAGIGWHKDAAVFGDKILGISLVSCCTLKLRKKINEKYTVVKQVLDPRSAYILSGESRLEWQHCIPPVKEMRISITFRTLK